MSPHPLIASPTQSIREALARLPPFPDPTAMAAAAAVLICVSFGEVSFPLPASSISPLQLFDEDAAGLTLVVFIEHPPFPVCTAVPLIFPKSLCSCAPAPKIHPQLLAHSSRPCLQSTPPSLRRHASACHGRWSLCVYMDMSVVQSAGCRWTSG